MSWDADRKAAERFRARHISFERAAAEGLHAIVAQSPSQSEGWYQAMIQLLRGGETSVWGRRRVRYLDYVLEHPQDDCAAIEAAIGSSRWTQRRYKNYFESKIKKSKKVCTI